MGCHRTFAILSISLQEGRTKSNANIDQIDNDKNIDRSTKELFFHFYTATNQPTQGPKRLVICLDIICQLLFCDFISFVQVNRALLKMIARRPAGALLEHVDPSSGGIWFGLFIGASSAFVEQ